MHRFRVMNAAIIALPIAQQVSLARYSGFFSPVEEKPSGVAQQPAAPDRDCPAGSK